DLTVGGPGEEAAGGGDERVGHRRERLGEPVRERAPRLIREPPVEARLRIAAAVGGERAGARRDVPQPRIVRIDGDGPGVAAVESVVGGPPALARVLAEGRSPAAGLVRPALRARMPRERVHVALRAGAVVLPG